MIRRAWNGREEQDREDIRGGFSEFGGTVCAIDRRGSAQYDWFHQRSDLRGHEYRATKGNDTENRGGQSTGLRPTDT